MTSTVDDKRQLALVAIRDAYEGLLAAQRNLLGYRLALTGVHRDQERALNELRKAQHLIEAAIGAIEATAHP